MKKRKRLLSKKGAVPWVVILVIAAVVVVAGFLAGYFGFGGGKGNGEGSGEGDNSAQSSQPESVNDSVLVVEEIKYLNVSVSDNEYLYQNSKLSLDELIAELNKIPDNVTVMVTDENASLKAFNKLTEALKDNDIRFIEAGAE